MDLHNELFKQHQNAFYYYIQDNMIITGKISFVEEMFIPPVEKILPVFE